MKKAYPQLIGAHVSTAGGIQMGPARAAALGCNFVQIFSDSPRIWQRREIGLETTVKFTEECEKNGILNNVIHSLYLVNLASEKPELVEKSIKSLVHDMNLAARIDSVGVVVHVGSYQDRGWDSAKEQVVKGIASIIEQTPGNAVFLIENAAGQGGKVGSDLSQIKYIMDELQAPFRVGWCLDTCHAFAAGLRFSKQAGDRYLFELIEENNLAESLRVIHVNDSKDDFFSHRDRHENLGDGKIGYEALKIFLHHPIIKGLPLALEVPGIEGTGPDIENVERLKKLLE